MAGIVLLRLITPRCWSMQAACCANIQRLSPLHTKSSSQQQPPPESKFRTTVEALRETANANESASLSNRKLFSRLRPDEKTIEKLDMLGLGSAKTGRFERKRWFRYEEPPVKLPHIAFFAGAQTASSFPHESLPEVGFVGRSNVGKSTLVNQLCKSVTARISERPGLTQQINFYTAGSDLHLVDMPGYGFAYAKDTTTKSWVPLIESYIRQRKSLRRVMILLDARHGIKFNDREFMALLDSTGTKYQIILTKCDLVHRIDLAKQHMLIAQQTACSQNCIPRIMMVSARNRAGLNDLRKEILHICSLGQKYLGLHKKKEAIAQSEYFEQLKTFNETSRAVRRRR
ncbi:hypothetical protein H4S08_000247 [Coemansia sp. RSA 1365]|nr:hypothetical protein H4S08_000247 [Coemansia sp. RSA 1365]